MTVQQISVNTHSRAQGHSATAGAAYRSGSIIVDERTGETHAYLLKGELGVEYAEIVLPAHAPEWMHDRSKLWNAAEAAEDKQKNPQNASVSRDWIVPLPAEFAGEGHEQSRLEIARELSQYLVNRFGFAADFAIHSPGTETDERNWHVHILTSTREVTEHGFENRERQYKSGQHKGEYYPSRKLDELNYNKNARQHSEVMREAIEKCNEITSHYLERAGHHVEAERWKHAHLTKEQQAEKAFERGDFAYYKEVSGKAASVHLGPSATAMERRGIESDAGNHNREVSKEALKKEAERLDWADRIKNDPSALLDKMLERKANFTQGDIEREAAKHTDNGVEMAFVVQSVMNDPRLVRVAEAVPATAKTSAVREKFSTIDFIALERNMVATAEVMKDRQSHRVDPATVEKVFAKYPTMTDEQRNAVLHVIDGKQLVSVIGDAGTGKSFSMGVAREIWEANGYRVQGIALAGKAAEELQKGSGIESRTIKSFTMRLDNGRDKIDAKTVIVLDEAGMVGSRQYLDLLRRAEKAGAKVAGAGDQKQLAAIEAGAAFRAIVEVTGAAEITETRRQKDDWQREASQQIARGDFAKGIEAYSERGQVTMSETRADARAALIDQYVRDLEKPNREGKPASQAIVTHTKVEVESLNNEVRDRLKERGQLQDGKAVSTAYGQREFATGDRILFRENNARLGEPEGKRGRPSKGSERDRERDSAKVTGVKNGSLGTVESMSENRITVKMDDGRKVTFDPATYQRFGHGYAATVHKSQGITVDRTYALVTPSMGKELAYVGATRHREDFHLHAAREDFRSYDKMVERTGKADRKETTLDYVPRDRDLSAQMEAYEKAKAAKTLDPNTAKALEAATPASRLERDTAFAERREAERKQSAQERRAGQEPQSRLEKLFAEARERTAGEPKQQPQSRLAKLFAEARERAQTGTAEPKQSVLERAAAKQEEKAQEPKQQQKDHGHEM